MWGKVFIFFQKPIVSISSFLIISKTCDELAYWVGLYLRYSGDGKSYEELVLKYGGPSDLLKKIFKFRSNLIDLDYIFQNYASVSIIFLLAVVILVYRKKIEGIFTDGRPRQVFKEICDFFIRDNKPVLWLMLFFSMYVTYRFTHDVYLNYLSGVNQHIVRALNDYSNRRIEIFNSLDNTEDCFFYVEDKSRIYDISYLDFIYLIVTGDNSSFAELLHFVTKLNPSLKVYLKSNVKEAYDFKLDKAYFTREEVESIILKIKQAPVFIERKMLNSVEEYFEIMYRAGLFEIYYNKEGTERKYFGKVDYKCTSNPEDLNFFRLKKLQSI